VSALLVALGAAVGAPLRLLAGHHLDRPRNGYTVHWGTLAVNLVGSAALGWLVGHGVDGRPLLLLGTGFCGAFTTYSAFAVKTHEHGLRGGTTYAVATVGLAVAACGGGYLLGQA
jgi:fluoride exporter